jgi:uncharacterized protein YrrD
LIRDLLAFVLLAAATMYLEKNKPALRNATDFVGNDVFAADGKIGKCSDVLFDKQEWKIRFLIVDAEDWLKDCKLLISSHLADGMQTTGLSVRLKRSEIENAPLLLEDEPVPARNGNSQSQSQNIFRIKKTAGLRGGNRERRSAPIGEFRIDVEYLQFGNERFNLSIKASDGELGQVEDLVADCDSWKLQYLVIATGSWPPRTKVIVCPSWIGKVDRCGDRVDLYMCSRRSGVKREEASFEAGCLNDYSSLPRYWGR